MDENTTKLIKERFDSLPQMIQEVILSSDYENSLLEIGKLYQLNVEQLGTLEQETTMAMMGLIPLKDFEVELTNALGVDKEKGLQIHEAINEKVFLKIRELLKLMNTGVLDESDTEKEAPSQDLSTNTTPQTEEEKNNAQTFKEHGIEIIPEKLELSTAEKDAASALGYSKLRPSISVQKLSVPVQTGTVKTEHSLPNISSPSNTPNVAPKMDPYREIPE